MLKVLVLAEGLTEERFIKNVLNPHLIPSEKRLEPIIVATKRMNSGGKFKGGVPSYEKVRREILRLLNDSSASMVTTMLDFYGLPETFPKRKDPEGLTPLERVQSVERAWHNDIHQKRFFPYLSLHEFEAILFSDPEETARGFTQPRLGRAIREIREQFHTPEDINDSPDTCPSRRLEKLFPRYSKPFYGSLISARIGLATIRRECPHFSAWLKVIETL
jgi:hypothetical protein